MFVNIDLKESGTQKKTRKSYSPPEKGKIIHKYFCAKSKDESISLEKFANSEHIDKSLISKWIKDKDKIFKKCPETPKACGVYNFQNDENSEIFLKNCLNFEENFKSEFRSIDLEKNQNKDLESVEDRSFRRQRLTQKFLRKPPLKTCKTGIKPEPQIKQTDKSVAKSKIERRNHAKSTFLKKCLGNFVCDHCNLSFKKILLLKKHIKNVHSNKVR